MATEQKTVLASIDANSAGVSHSGAIVREGRQVTIELDGTPIARAGSFDSASHRLAGALERALPRQRDVSWGVAVRCVSRPDVALVFGNLSGGGGGGAGGIPNPCVARIVVEYRKGENTLDRALAAAARLLASCCGRP